MTRLSRLALAHPSITVLLILVLFVGGILAAGTLNQELIPDVEFPQATVLTVYPGASAADMTESVTRPIEDALEQIDDVDVIEVSSNTSESVSTVTLRGEYGTTQDEIREAVMEAGVDVGAEAVGAAPTPADAAVWGAACGAMGLPSANTVTTAAASTKADTPAMMPIRVSARIATPRYRRGSRQGPPVRSR